MNFFHVKSQFLVSVFPNQRMGSVQRGIERREIFVCRQSDLYVYRGASTNGVNFVSIYIFYLWVKGHDFHAKS